MIIRRPQPFIKANSFFLDGYSCKKNTKKPETRLKSSNVDLINDCDILLRDKKRLF
jgi:hypothetical protein